MKLHIRKRRVQMSGPVMWVWWCGQEPDGPRCDMSRRGWKTWAGAMIEAFDHAFRKHDVILGDPLSDEEEAWGWRR